MRHRQCWHPLHPPSFATLSCDMRALLGPIPNRISISTGREALCLGLPISTRQRCESCLCRCRSPRPCTAGIAIQRQKTHCHRTTSSIRLRGALPTLVPALVLCPTIQQGTGTLSTVLVEPLSNTQVFQRYHSTILLLLGTVAMHGNRLCALVPMTGLRYATQVVVPEFLLYWSFQYPFTGFPGLLTGTSMPSSLICFIQVDTSPWLVL